MENDDDLCTTDSCTLAGCANEPLDCDEFVCGDSKEVRDRAIAVLERIPRLDLAVAAALAIAAGRAQFALSAWNAPFVVHGREINLSASVGLTLGADPVAAAATIRAVA